MPKLFIVVNEDIFFLSHRKPIALAARREGFDVTIITKDTGFSNEIKNLGFRFVDFPVNPTGMNLLQEFKTFVFLISLYNSEKPDIVHHVGLKSILWGSLAAKLAKVNGMVNAVSGLGTLFANEDSFIAKNLVRMLRVGHKHKNLKVIFQNHDDENLFVTKGVSRSSQNEFIKGAGIDLNDYMYAPIPQGDKIRIIFTGRMIVEKGVKVLVEAAELLRNNYEDRVEFWLVGGLSSNPKALKKEEIESFCDGKYIKWLGYRTDVKELLARASIVAFPSFYREGLPKSLIEANATGRPIVTTDSIGCRDTVYDGRNGFLVPIKDSKLLAEKLRILLDDEELRNKMGKEARKIAEKEFSIDEVVEKHIKIYNLLLKCH